ncbi:veswaprin-b-like isoform 1-T1 [Gastrophryne carolinensis]
MKASTAVAFTLLLGMLLLQVATAVSKPGTCPQPPATFAPCPKKLPQNCANDWICQDDLKCCKGACVYECVKPESNQECPNPIPCFAPDADPECKDDSECSPNEKCCVENCEQLCVPV